METTYYRFTAVSSNSKTGPIQVTTTSSNTCPDACPLKVDPETGKPGPCYAKGGPLAIKASKVRKALVKELGDHIDRDIRIICKR